MRKALALACLLSLPVGTALAAPRAADPMAGFIKSCQTQMYMSGAACACLAAKAGKELDPEAIAYLSLPALDVNNSTRLAKSMSGAEMAKIDRFMRDEPRACQGAK
ncbi:MAG TPA: hypothetical protein VHB74_09780 [Devosia sp.]|nr:hypothetical protein [Devosia sp.]